MFRFKILIIGYGSLILLQPLTVYSQICQTNILPTTPTHNFIDHKNGTVTDKKTGLMWKKCSEGQIWLSNTGNCRGSASGYSWQNALQRAQFVNTKGGFAGKKDWRVPNIKELASIVEEQCFNPAINLTVFPNSIGTEFWTSSPYAGNGTWAWHLNFDSYGILIKYNKKYHNQVRLVRGQ